MTQYYEFKQKLFLSLKNYSTQIFNMWHIGSSNSKGPLKYVRSISSSGHWRLTNSGNFMIPYQIYFLFWKFLQISFRTKTWKYIELVTLLKVKIFSFIITVHRIKKKCRGIDVQINVSFFTNRNIGKIDKTFISAWVTHGVRSINVFSNQIYIYIYDCHVSHIM